MRSHWTKGKNSQLDDAREESDSRATPRHGKEDEGRILTWPIGIFASVIGILTASFWGRVTAADDFSSLWIAGLLYRDGDKQLLYDRSPEDFSTIQDEAWWEYARNLDVSGLNPYPHPFVHIPIMAEFNSYLSQWMDYATAVWILTAISGFALVMIVSASWQMWFKETIGLVPLALGTMALWLSIPAQVSLGLGQTSPVITAGILSAIALAGRRPLLAGLLLGAVTAIKITPIFVICAMFIYSRTRKAGFWSLGVTVAIAGYSFMKDMNSFREWIHVLGDISSSGILHFLNLSPLAFLAHDDEIISYRGNHAVLPITPVVEELNPIYVWGVRAIVIILLVIVALFAWKSRERGFELFAVGGYVVSMLASNILWQHYLVILPALVIGIVWFAHFITARARTALLLATVCVACTFYSPLPAQGAQDVVGVEWLMFYGFLALLVMFLVAAGGFVREGMEDKR